MPDMDQVTPDDFKAPKGQHRIMREEMPDGKLSIVADFHLFEFAKLGLESARAAHPEDVFTLCNDEEPLQNH